MRKVMLGEPNVYSHKLVKLEDTMFVQLGRLRATVCFNPQARLNAFRLEPNSLLITYRIT
jgi:hypothetical protein